MRGLLSRPPPSAPFSMLRPAAQRASALSVSCQGLLESPHARLGLLSGILQSVGNFLGFGNDQAHPSDPKDTATGGASSTGGIHEPTNVQPPAHEPSPPAQAPPASYPAPGGGGQVEKPTSSVPVSVPSASIGSASNAAGTAPHSTSPPTAMNVAPTPSTTPPTDESHHVSDIYGGKATSYTASHGWPSISSSVSPASSPTDPPTTAAHAQRFPPAAAAAIGAVLGFVVVSAVFWAVWLALRKRRCRARVSEFASVHPKWVSVPESVGVRDENPFVHPRDEKEDDPLDLSRASTARSLASTLSV